MFSPDPIRYDPATVIYRPTRSEPRTCRCQGLRPAARIEMFAAMRGRHTISRAGTARVALVIDCSVPWELQLCRGSEPAHVANLTRSGQPPA
jgi:hypothetical protein